MNQSKEWHESRRKGIGGSDCAAIMGKSPFNTALDIYYQKVNEYEEYDNGIFKRGRRLEKYVLEEYAEHTGETLEVNLPMIQDTKYPFLIGHIDAKIQNQNVIIEAKSSQENPSAWPSIPEMYLIQIAHYAAITDAERVDLAVLFNRWQYGCFSYYRDEKLESEIREAAINFWQNHVIPRIPPAPQTKEDTLKAYPTSVEYKTIEATKDIEKKVIELADISEKIRLLNNEKEKLKFDIMSYMQDAEKLNTSTGYSMIWKSSNQNRLNTNKLKIEQPAIYANYLTTSELRPLKLISNTKTKGSEI